MGTNKSSILERNEIVLNETQNKLIASGWGQEVLVNTITEKITYLSDDLKVKGYISYPTDKSKKYPSSSESHVADVVTGILSPFRAIFVTDKTSS